MAEHNWRARNKNELAIEVWEKLDCESVGRAELEAITTVLKEVYGEGAVPTPAVLARLLADEGAELRHVEVLELDVERRLDDPYQPMFRNLIKLANLDEATTSMRALENLRRKFAAEKDQVGARRLLELARRAKQRLLATVKSSRTGPERSRECAELAEWLTVWLNQPEVFDTWLDLRRRAPDFKEKFGEPVSAA
jgi:hypothetical protein